MQKTRKMVRKGKERKEKRKEEKGKARQRSQQIEAQIALLEDPNWVLSAYPGQ